MMTSFSEIEVFSKEDLAFLARAERLVECVPQSRFHDVRCHELARAVGKLLDLEIVDGKYGCVEHSWLLCRNSRAFLDVYAVGQLPMVKLVDLNPALPHLVNYVSGERRCDIDEEKVDSLVRAMHTSERRSNCDALRHEVTVLIHRTFHKTEIQNGRCVAVAEEIVRLFEDGGMECGTIDDAVRMVSAVYRRCARLMRDLHSDDSFKRWKTIERVSDQTLDSLRAAVCYLEMAAARVHG